VSSGDVVVFTMPFCPPCDQLAAYLKARHVAFTLRDPMMDEAAALLLEHHHIRSAPALQVGDTIIGGRDLVPARIDALLGL
jgi:glutaredoxin